MSRDRRNACFVVWPERITRIVASARGESTTASVTDKSWRSIDHDVVVHAAQLRRCRSLMLAEASNSAGFGGGVPAGMMKRLGKIGEVVIVCCSGSAPGQDIAETAAWSHAQRLVNAGSAQVGIDQENPDAFLREHDCGVDAGGGFAFLRPGARHHDHFGWRAEIGEQKRSSQRAVRFRHLRLRANLGYRFDHFLGRGQGQTLSSRIRGCLTWSRAGSSQATEDRRSPVPARGCERCCPCFRAGRPGRRRI